MKIGDLEYIIKRLIRRYIFPNSILYAIKRIFPTFLFRNANITDTEIYINTIKNVLASLNTKITQDKTVVEIGAGATCSYGYEISGRFGCKYFSHEPYVNLNKKIDEKMYAKSRVKYPELNKENVIRIDKLSSIPDASVDFIISSSVLEHVYDFSALTAELKRIIAPNGIMIHQVDYRDHYFKYPYHFLLFSKKIWSKYLSPKSLPRWRISDHIKNFRQVGFEASVFQKNSLETEFDKIKHRIHPEFSNYSEDSLKTAYAIITVQIKHQTD